MGYRLNVPPTWPAPPPGWVPPAGWQPDPAWGPAPDGWTLWVWDDSTGPASQPGGVAVKRHSVLTLVLLGAAVLFSVALSFSQSDRAMIMEDPPSSTGGSLAVIWVVAGLVILVIWIAARGPRPRAVRAVIVALVVPVLGVAVFSTFKLHDLASSGFLDRAQAEQREAQALREQAFTVCTDDGVVDEAAPIAAPYRLLVLDENGQDFAADAVEGRGWTAGSASELQIVVCVGSEHESTRYCNYEGGHSYKHVYYVRDVSVVEARTGVPLSQTEISGGGIDDCAATVPGDVPDEVGDHVDPDQAIDYVAGVLADLP